MTPPTAGSEGRADHDGRVDYGPFAHLTVPNTALYRSVMCVFTEVKERFAVHLRPEDVYAALAAPERPSDLEALTKALDSLADWGNLRAARVTVERSTPNSSPSTECGRS